MNSALMRRSGTWIAVGVLAFGISFPVFAGGEAKRGRGELSERERDEKNELRRDRMNKNKHGGHFGRGNKKNARGRMSMLLSSLSEEEQKELAELRKNDNEAYRDKIRQFAKKYKKQHAQEQKEIKSLAKKIRKASNEDEKNELIAKLRSNLLKQFNVRMAMNRKNYEQAAKRLKDLKKKLDAREKKADEIIERKFKELIGDPDLKW